MSTVRLRLSRRDSLLEDEDVCLSREEEECLDDLLSFSLSDECFDDEEVLDDDLEDDFSCGTSRMFRIRPVVGSVVESWPGSWDTWYPSIM
jgi:hypothetical protein